MSAAAAEAILAALGWKILPVKGDGNCLFVHCDSGGVASKVLEPDMLVPFVIHKAVFPGLLTILWTLIIGCKQLPHNFCGTFQFSIITNNTFYALQTSANTVIFCKKM